MSSRSRWIVALALPFAQEAPAAICDEIDVAARLEAIRSEGTDGKVPALGAALVTTEGIEGVWVTGVREAGSDVSVETGDRWHIGSCTKSMTATLIALLVERGDLDWDLKLCELLPEIADEMHDDFVDVTLVELLSHRAGVSNDVAREGLWRRCMAREGSAVDQRRMLARTVLSWPPEHPPRTKFLYSNPGVAIAGHAAETVTGKPYEELMQELLFAPLGITTAGFGAPGSPEEIDQPRGHGGDGKPIAPGPDADNPPAIAPAGTAHMSLADWGRYVSLHLRGAKGDVTVGEITLRAETFRKLHAPYEGPGESYALGWLVTERPWAGPGGRVLAHSGSNTMWFCVAWAAPDAGFAVLAASNGSLGAASGPVDRAASFVIQSRKELLARPARADSGGEPGEEH